jgi:DNA-3-methyladenine glycosylase II
MPTTQPSFEAGCAPLAKADPVLGRIIKRVGPCPVKPRSRAKPYESLVKAVTYQQLNGKAAETIFNRFKALFPSRRFPEPEDILGTPDDRLRSAGLSRNKLAAIKDIAAKTIDGTVPSNRTVKHLSDYELLERLTTIRGVGPWTVEMLLIFTLGRPDVLPATDYGVRQGFALTYRRKDLPKPQEILEHGERWRPWRSVAAWYLWRALEIRD